MSSQTTSPTRAGGLIRMAGEDDVAVAARDLAEGEQAGVEGAPPVTVRGPVPRGHKVALRAVDAGRPVYRYGQVIGFAARAIAAGEHVHTHNLEYREFERHPEFAVDTRAEQVLPAAQRATFEGYVRADGRVGTRNYLGVLSSVNCSATAAKRIAARIENSGLLEDFPHVDGVVALTHGTGCGMDRDGEGMAVLRRVMAGYLAHPNFAGFLVLGLGCEDNQIAALTGVTEPRSDLLVSAATIQELGGTTATVAEGVRRLTAMLPEADRARRSTVPASELILGTNCGGSDSYSGLTANPALGGAADLLVRHGGTVVLGETPEIYGTEHLLTRRAASREVGEKLLARIEWWREYTASHGGSMDNNPSPGNKAGGLTTILEKSLGAVAKGGTTTLREVVEYAEAVPRGTGLVFMDTPGYDPVSVTGIVAGGANMVCFTTGRGSAFGCKPVPSLKLATNSELYRRMSEDMDIDCGPIATGHAGVEEIAEQIFHAVLEAASGTRTKSEQLGYGDEEFVPWQLGTVM